MDAQKQLREHLRELLAGESAHVALETVLNDFPLHKINERPGNTPHSGWQLLEHIRIAQWDILEFSRDANHVSPDFPDGYWNKSEGTAEDWKKSAEIVLNDLQAIRNLIDDEKNDLFAAIPHGDGQTLLREALVVADHNSYHLGQLAFLMKALQNK